MDFVLKTDLTGKANDTIKLKETTFILIREELTHRGIERFYDQRDFIEKNVMRVYLFTESSSKFDILILENRCDIEDFRSIMETYKLLPNDALKWRHASITGQRR